jgi:Caspase domain
MLKSLVSFHKRRLQMRMHFGAAMAALLTAFFIALLCPAARAETRVALIIGNGAYQHLPRLNNPPGDARDLAGALKKLDFDVDLGVDLAIADMQRRVTAFAKRAQTADVALAFFAGHGVQAPDPGDSSRALNYLLPVDADIREEADLGFLLTARDVIARRPAACAFSSSTPVATIRSRSGWPAAAAARPFPAASAPSRRPAAR